MPRTRIVKWGNSLAVRIPKPLAQAAHVGEGDSVEIRASTGKIELSHRERIPTLQELVAQITPDNRYREVSPGKTRGKENLEW